MRPARSAAGSDHFSLADGRIAQTWHLEDYFGIATQLGLTFSR